MSPRLTTQILQVGAPMSAASWSAIKPSAWLRLEPRPTSSKIWLILFSVDIDIAKLMGRLTALGGTATERSRFTVILVCWHVDVNYSLWDRGLRAIAPHPRECIIERKRRGRARVQVDGWKSHTALPHIERDWKRRYGCGLQSGRHKASPHGSHQSAFRRTGRRREG